jgi:hypothetical protein
VCIFAFGVWATWNFIKQADIIFQELDRIIGFAKAAKTKVELDQAWKDLVDVHKKCGLRHFSPKITEAKTIIETKYQFVK